MCFLSAFHSNDCEGSLRTHNELPGESIGGAISDLQSRNNFVVVMRVFF